MDNWIHHELGMGSRALTQRKKKVEAIPDGDESRIPQRRDVGLKRRKREGGLPHFLEEQAKQQSQEGEAMAAAPLDPTEVAIRQARNLQH